MSHAATIPPQPTAPQPDAVPAAAAPAISPRHAPAPKTIAIPSVETSSRRSFGRLLHAELRKLVDTRAGLWLLITMALLTILTTFGAALFMGYLNRPGSPVAGKMPLDLLVAASSGGGIMATFIALLAILSIAGEWGQRTTLTTFALEPRRGLVLAAKAVVVLAIATLVVALSFPLGAAGEAVAHAVFHAPVSYHLTAAQVFGYWLTMMLGGPLMGMAFALLLLNTPAGIVTYLVLPILLNLLNLIQFAWSPFAKALRWINPTVAQTPFTAGWHLADLGPLATTSLIWIALPAAIGAWRWMRRECK